MQERRKEELMLLEVMKRVQGECETRKQDLQTGKKKWADSIVNEAETSSQKEKCIIFTMSAKPFVVTSRDLWML